MTEIVGLLLNDCDNVATIFGEVKKGQEIKVYDKKGNYNTVKVIDKISYGHKVAINAINKGEKIIKYGEVIGLATINIKLGEHVHIHNLESIRGRGDLE